MKAKTITDFGQSYPLVDAKTGEVTQWLPRYAVWGRSDHGRKDEVIFTSNSLEEISEKYGDLPVIKIGKEG